MLVHVGEGNPYTLGMGISLAIIDDAMEIPAKAHTGTSEKAQHGKALAAKPKVLTYIPGTHMLKENTDSGKLSSDLCIPTDVGTYTHTKHIM